MKIFFDTTKLENLKNIFLIFVIVMVLLTLFSCQKIGNEERVLLSEIIRGNVYLFADNRNLVVLLPIFYLALILDSIFHIIILQLWIQMIEKAEKIEGIKV